MRRSYNSCNVYFHNYLQKDSEKQNIFFFHKKIDIKSQYAELQFEYKVKFQSEDCKRYFEMLEFLGFKIVVILNPYGTLFHAVVVFFTETVLKIL